MNYEGWLYSIIGISCTQTTIICLSFQGFGPAINASGIDTLQINECEFNGNTANVSLISNNCQSVNKTHAARFIHYSSFFQAGGAVFAKDIGKVSIKGSTFVGNQAKVGNKSLGLTPRRVFADMVYQLFHVLLLLT